MRPRISCCLSVLLFLAVASPAGAQWSSSASTNLNLSTSSTLSGSPGYFCFPDQAGGAVIAWGDGRGTVVQRLDAFGNKKWGANATVISQTNQTLAPRAISDDAGGVIVGWTETASGHTGYYVQRVDRSGTALWPAGGIAANSIGTSYGICSDGANGVIVVWTQTVGSLVNVYANRITANGSLPWGATGKLVHSSGDIKIVDVVQPSISNGAILAWHHFNSANLSDPDTLSFQRIDGNGNNAWGTPGAPGGVRLITLDDTTIERSCIGASGSVFFTTQRGDSAYLHRLQSSGAFASPVVGWPIVGPPNGKWRIAVCNAMIPDGAGGVVVAWRDESYGGSIFGRIRAQRINASGTRQWPTSGGTFVQVCASSNDENFPSIVRDGYGHFVFGWEDYRNGTNINLWSERLDAATGAPLWASAGVFFASATDHQFWPQFAAGNPGNVIAAFNDARTGSGRMYAQFLGPNGVLTPPTTVPFTTAAPITSARGAAGYASAGNQLFVEGGGGVGSSPVGNSLLRFTAGSNTWDSLGTGYVARWFGNLVYVPETGKLYSLNGNDNVSSYHNTVEEITLVGGVATPKATNPLPREGAGAAAVGGKIYVVSGNNDVLAGGLVTDVRAFDPGANSWGPPLAPLVPARSGLTATTYNGAIYAFGGTLASGVSTNVLQRYDPGANTWTALTPAPLPLAWHAAAVTGGLIWYAGDVGTGWTLMSYAPATDSWTVYTTDMVSRRFAQAAGLGNTLVVSGGSMGTPSQNVLDTQVSDVSALVAATPLAMVTLPVTALGNQLLSGDLAFAAPGESTLVTLNFASVAGAGTATVARYVGPPVNVSFSSGTPTTVGTTRWEVGATGLDPFSATIKVQLFGLPDALGAGNGITLYRRDTPGTGSFAPVPTTFDPVANRVEATTTAFGEFILGAGGSVGVPIDGEAAPVALAIRPLANPVHGVPAFRITLPEASTARLELFDLAGRVIASQEVTRPAGSHTVHAGPGDARPGLYFARLTQGRRMAMTRLVVER